MPINAVDINSIPSALQQRIIEGLKTSELAFAEEACTVRTEPTTRSGAIPLLQSVFTLARGNNGGLAPLEPAVSHGGAMSTVNYSVLAYVGTDLVSDEERADMAYFSVDALTLHMANARRNANAAIDKKLESVLLDSATLNNAYDVRSSGDGSGEWNTAASAPLDDLQQAADNFAPDADTLILGRKVYNALVRNDDFIAESSHFAQAGQIPYDALAGMLRSRIPNLQNVMVFDKKVNDALLDGTGNTPPGAAGVQFRRLFDSGAWLGYKSHLIMVAPRVEGLQDRSDVERITNQRAHQVQYARYIDIIRPQREMGVAFTNILA